MLDQLSRRLDEAQGRLHAALVAGEPTDAHRAAISQLEHDIERERFAQKQADAERARRRTSAIKERADAIADEARQRIADLIARFPLTSESQP